MQKKLSIIVPVYNEAVYVIRSLENIVQVKLPNYIKEIIVVNDGSTDNTLSLLETFVKENTEIKILTSQTNSGKGYALQKGIKSATGDIVIIQDADLEYDPSDYTAILSKFEDSKVNVVYGSRILGAKIYHNYTANFFFFLGGITLTKIVNIFLGTKLTDQPTCYKSWRAKLSPGLLTHCHSKGFEFEVEMTSFFAKLEGITEVPIHYYPRTVNHGKKIRLSDFIKSILMLFKVRF